MDPLPHMPCPRISGVLTSAQSLSHSRITYHLSLITHYSRSLTLLPHITHCHCHYHYHKSESEIAMASEEPSSWGETIRAYESGKKALPWRPGDVQPVQKLGAFEVTHSHTHSLTHSLAHP
jgi:hypothetical protein